VVPEDVVEEDGRLIMPRTGVTVDDALVQALPTNPLGATNIRSLR